MQNSRKTATVDLVCCTLMSGEGREFVALAPDGYVYRFALKKGSPSFQLGDMVWLYRAKSEHLVVDYVPYENNQDLLDSFDPYEVDV